MLHNILCQVQEAQEHISYSAIGVIAALFAVVAAIYRYGKASVTKKDLDDAKAELKSEINLKVDKTAFETFQEEVWKQSDEHELVNNTTFALIREDMKEYRKEQADIAKSLNSINVKLSEAVTDIKWLKTNLNK